MFRDTKNLIFNKIEKSKIKILSDEKDPLMVDTTSNGDYFPTIYLLSLYPNMVNIVFVLKPGVEKFLYTGANLMWPGVEPFSSDETFCRGKIVAIVTSQGFICAIGTTSCDKKEYEAHKGKEGIAAFILHYYGDELFDWGSKILKTKTKNELNESHDKKNDEQEPQVNADPKNNINNTNVLNVQTKDPLYSEQTNNITIPNDYNKNGIEPIKI